MGLEKEEAVASIVAIFKRGNSTNGNNATTGMGMASLIHKAMINVTTAKTLFALASTCNGLTKKIKREIRRLTHIPIYGLESFRAMELVSLYYWFKVWRWITRIKRYYMREY